MKAVTAAEMREIDEKSEKEYGIPGELLMGFAGRAAASSVLKNFPDSKSIAVLAGTGNNGGDGFAAAYFLAAAGVSVKVFLCGGGALTKAAALFHSICLKSGVEIENGAPGALDGFELIIDALLGTGFDGPPHGWAAEAIAKINSSSLPVLSLDIPSGLQSDGQAPEWNTVKASLTATMGLPKISLVTWPGLAYCGTVETADIGFPKNLTSSPDIKTELIDDEFIFRAAPSLQIACGDIDKNTKGHLLLAGGFDGMEGAIIMSAKAALETGVGLISLITTPKARGIIAGKIPELITIQAQADAIHSLLRERKYDSLIIGPGMGRGEDSAELFTALMDALPEDIVVVIDGDGLFHLASYLKNQKLKSTVKYILTPHFNEASRIMEKSVDEIKANRLAAAKECSARTGCVVLLKGPASIVSDGEFAYINTSGNSLLAAAGSGDVLSGILGALLLRGAETRIAACAACFFHGKAADLLASKGAKHLKASDIIEAIKNTGI
ncbi:MAG: NAD(P)H-hydrate dehydratase [Leptospirales bacterium]|nr:NAD(P)H-hydrate dehydratase [Leptospirales bacterium]